MDASKKLIDRIKEQNIQPAPRWHFTLKNSLLLAGFVLAVLLGGLAFSIVLFAIQQTDFSVMSHLSHSPLELFLGLLPVLWITLLILSLLAAMYSIRHSKKGYKFSAFRQMAFSVALSILLGTLFFITGGAQRLEHAFEINIELYESINEKKIQLWVRPEEGQLAGKITAMEENSMELTDFYGNSWKIRFSDNTFIPPVVLMERGELIKLIGTKTGQGEFSAEEIRPWQGPGFQRRFGRQRRGNDLKENE